MRLLFASDIHGSPRTWNALAGLAHECRPDAILLGGDLFSNSAPVEAAPAAQRGEAGEPFARWCAAAGAPVYWIAGNHEWATTVDPPPGAGICVHGRCVPLGDWDLIGFSLCSPTPYWLIDHERREEFSTRREPRGRCWMSQGVLPAPVDNPNRWLDARPTLADELRALPAPRDWSRTVLMAHNPPFDTGLDLRWGNLPVGSADVREFILRVQPAISLHGHIHEAPLLSGSATHRVGRTLGCNAGRSDAAIRALWIDLADPGVATLIERP